MARGDEKDMDCIEVWEDTVRIKDLVFALVTTGVTTMGGYFAAPGHAPLPLLCGLIGAVAGFAVCSFVIKPKRVFIEKTESEE